ncbi:MAG: glycosyl hydrolase 115 family protein, partial [Bryobacteraceae bacterium]
VPVSRIYSELGRYIKAGATNYLLLNTSDIRPVSMTAKAVMDLAWKGLPPGRNAAEYYRDWAAEEFGKRAAPQIAAVYKAYFAAPASTTVHGRVHEYGDNYYHTEARLLLLAYMTKDPLYSLPSQSPRWIEPHVFDFPKDPAGPAARRHLSEIAAREVRICKQAQPRWDAVWSKALALEKSVLPERLPYYRAQVLAMIAINRESNRMLWQTAQAIQQGIAGDSAAAHASAKRALEAIFAIHKAEAAAEYGKWKHWYRGDWLTNVNRTGDLLAIFSKYVQNPLTPLPAPVLWSGWEAYHHIMLYESDRAVDVK